MDSNTRRANAKRAFFAGKHHLGGHCHAAKRQAIYLCFFSEELVKNRDFQTGGAAQYIPDKAGDRKKNIGTSKRKSLAKVKCQGVDSDHRPKAYEGFEQP